MGRGYGKSETPVGGPAVPGTPVSESMEHLEGNEEGSRVSSRPLNLNFTRHLQVLRAIAPACLQHIWGRMLNIEV